MKEKNEGKRTQRERSIGGDFPCSLFLILTMSAVVGFISTAAQAQYILQYHRTADRAGNYVVPNLTPELAQHIHLDQTFDGRVNGQVYAQPLLTSAAGHEFCWSRLKTTSLMRSTQVRVS